METYWVLAYILRFPGEKGEWAQVHRQTYATEDDARKARNSMSNPEAYQICPVQVEFV